MNPNDIPADVQERDKQTAFHGSEQSETMRSSKGVPFGDQTQLESSHPREAVGLYLDARKDEIAPSTYDSQQYRLMKFVTWCETESIENTTNLTGRLCYKYRIWLQNTDLSEYTVLGMMSTFKTFLRFCEQIEAVQGGLSEKVLIPSVDREEKSRDTYIDEERAHEVRNHLRKYEWGSRNHVIFETLWSTAMRVSGLHSLDVGDFDEQGQSLQLQHRPNRETSLKNGTDGARPVALSDTLTEIMADYIDVNRIPCKDSHGRRPLITSDEGRLSKSQARKTIALVTQPCRTQPCPHGKSRDSCEWVVYEKANQCPSSYTPHDVRRGSITYLKDQKNLPTEVISDRADVSQKVLDESYDKRSEDDKMELRRQYLEDMDL